VAGLVVRETVEVKQWSRVAAVVAAVLSSMFWVGAAGAITIDFIEPAEGGNIIVRVDGVQANVPLNPETVSFDIPVPGVQLPAVSLSFIGALTEPPAGSIVSDAVQLSVTSTSGPPPSSTISLIFLSDSAARPKRFHLFQACCRAAVSSWRTGNCRPSSAVPSRSVRSRSRLRSAYSPTSRRCPSPARCCSSVPACSVLEPPRDGGCVVAEELIVRSRPVSPRGAPFDA
jgi:hypothetical protein